MRASLVLALFCSACSIPEKHLDDAQGSAFACLNQPLPTTANLKIAISGMASDPFTGDTLDTASVQGFLVGVSSAIFTTSTGAQGAFTHDQGTGGFPRDAFLRVSENGYLDSYFYPAAPLTHDYYAQIQALSSSDFTSIGTVAGVTLNPALAQILVVVKDCNGMPIPGATVSSQPEGTIRYFINGTPTATATSTDARTGVALIANTPVSNTQISSLVSGMVLRSHTIDTVAGTVMQVEIQP